MHLLIIRNAFIFLHLARSEHPGLQGADVLGTPPTEMLGVGDLRDDVVGEPSWVFQDKSSLGNQVTFEFVMLLS